MHAGHIKTAKAKRSQIGFHSIAFAAIKELNSLPYY